MLRFVWKALVPGASLPHPDEAACTPSVPARDRPLEQQVGGRVRGRVVLERAEVVHLVLLAEVRGDLVARGAAAVETASVRTRA